MDKYIKYIVYGISVLMVWIIAACQDEYISQQQEDTVKVPVKIRAKYAKPVLESRLNYSDNGVVSDPVQVTWTENEKIKVYVKLSKKDGTTPTVKWVHAYMAIVEGAGTSEALFGGWLNLPAGHVMEEGAEVYAFYPITSELSLNQMGMEIDLNRMVTNYKDLSELMYYDYMLAQSTFDSDCIDLNFKHQVSMLRLELTFPQTSVVKAVNEIKVESKDLFTKGKLMFGDGMVQIIPNSGDERHRQFVQFGSAKPVTSKSGNVNCVAHLMVMPGTLKAENPLTITAEVGGDVYSQTITFSKDHDLIPGMRYAVKASLEEKVVADYSWYDDGKATGEYVLMDESDLRGFSNITNGVYLPSGYSQCTFKDEIVKLGQNVTLTADWLPAGSSAQFAGVFDGQGYTIGNMKIDRENQLSQALFFSISDGAIVRNLTVDGEVVCFDGGAGIVGMLLQSSVINCTNKATVSIVSQDSPIDEETLEEKFPCVGGLVGYSLQGNIVACTNYGTIKSVNKGYSGGIVGYNHAENLDGIDKGGYVIACCNFGTIIGDNHASGIIGHNRKGFGEAIGCFNNYIGMLETDATAKYAINLSHEANGCYVIADEISESFVDKKYLTASSQEDLNNINYVHMNEAIVVHNKDFDVTSKYYCNYQWKQGAEWPVTYIIDSGGGTTGNYGDGGQLGN